MRSTDVEPRVAPAPAPTSSGSSAAEPDLSTLSSPVVETCSALTLSLWDGDGPAAARLFGFLLDQMPDRRSAVGDVLAPLLAREHARRVPRRDRYRFVAACSDLIVGLRRPVGSAPGDTALLHARPDGLPALLAQLIAVLLDDAHVPASLVLDADDGAVLREAASARHPVACLPAVDAATLRRSEELIRGLRESGTAVVLVGTAVAEEPGLVQEVGATAGAAQPGAAADLVARLRGPLSRAEADVLRMAADGYTNQRIAHELGISLSAVKARLEGGYAKLGAADRTHAVAIALRQRWIR